MYSKYQFTGHIIPSAKSDARYCYCLRNSQLATLLVLQNKDSGHPTLDIYKSKFRVSGFYPAMEPHQRPRSNP